MRRRALFDPVASLLLAASLALLAASRTLPCTPGCHCFKTTVRCITLRLEHLPHIPHNTTVLDLRFNRIRRLVPGSLSHLRHLQTFLMNDNHVTRLESGTFRGLHSLKHLFLHRNRIEVIEAGALDGLKDLQHLYLHMNRIEDLPRGLLTSLPNLQRVFLHENRLKRVEKDSLPSAPPLTRLRLDSNDLVCDCGLAWVNELVRGPAPAEVSGLCAHPHNLRGHSISDLHPLPCREPMILKGPENERVEMGSTARLICTVDGDPMPTVHWSKNRVEMEPDSHDRYSWEEDGSLVIQRVNEADLGSYACTAMSPLGQVHSQPAHLMASHHTMHSYSDSDFEVDQDLTVEEYKDEESVWLRRPEDQLCVEGDTVQLECGAEGAENVSWSLNGSPISEDVDRRRVISSEGTLTIQDVQPEDHGQYSCNIVTSLSRLHAVAQLTVHSRPRLKTEPQNVWVVAGEDVKLQCLAEGIPEPLITWYKNGETVLPAFRRHFINGGRVLHLEKTVDSDSGTYTCIAENVEGRVEGNAEVRVKSIGPPVLLLTPFPLSAIVGTSVELPCKAEGQPSPRLTWFRNGHLLNLDDHHKVFPLGSLRIYDLKLIDAGIYMCVASNLHGNISAEALLNVVPQNSGGSEESVGADNLVLRALYEARESVDRAVNSTIDKLFLSKSRSNNPSSLMRLIRYPDEDIRQFVRAADVFEKTLINIRRYVASGLHSNNTQDFHYEEVLTEEQLELIERLSGCMQHQQPANCSDHSFHSKYRTIDGTCNNLKHPHWGASLTPFRRLLKPVYENGFSSPVGWSNRAIYHGFPKPGARIVSQTVIRANQTTEDRGISHMVMQWGQFLDHDLDHAVPSTSAESWEGIDCKKTCRFSPPCFPIEVPRGDGRIHNRRCMDFIRSSAVCGSGITSVFMDRIHPREQINQLSAFIDASQIYGYTVNRSRLVRDFSVDEGLLREGLEVAPGKRLLPLAGSSEVDCRRDPAESDIGCFLAGDIRANEQVGLLAMHTLWLREHNRVARALGQINKHWGGETLFNEARKIVGAVMQRITYTHWLPRVLGPRGMEMLGEYKGYKEDIDPSVSNVFATAALRFGHTLIQPVLKRLDADLKTIPEGDLVLGDALFSPWRLIKQGGVDPLMRGLFTTPAKLNLPRQGLNAQLTERLFEPGHAVALDLAAINIQRARDHGLPPYVDYHSWCGLPPVRTFDDLKFHISDPDIRDKLEQLYGHPGNVDVWVGGVLEDTLPEAKVGPTFLCLLVEQFKRFRDGDRFWYEKPGVFEPAQLKEIERASLARILCDNGDNLTKVTRNVFLVPDDRDNQIVSCNDVPSIDLSQWYNCHGCSESDIDEDRRERRGLDVEGRVGSLEGAVTDLKRDVTNLRRRLKRLSSRCIDSTGKKRVDGEQWTTDPCTYCLCQRSSVSCTTLKCNTLSCPNISTPPGKCCPQCDPPHE